MSRKQLLAFACLLALAAGADAYAQSARQGQGGGGEPARRALAQVLTLGGGNYLGVQTEELTRENMGRFQLSGEPRGVGVAEVSEGGPAARAGLQKGDVIVRFDGEPVTSAAKLRRLIAEAAPEHAARLTILRGGAEREVTAKLGRREEGAFGDFQFPEGQTFRFDGDEWKKQAEQWKKFGDEWKKQGEQWNRQDENWKERSEEWKRHSDGLLRQLESLPRGNFSVAFAPGRRIGVTTTPLTEQLADYFGVSERRGVLVMSVAADSPAAKAGLKAGDVIVEADGEKVTEAGELSRVLGRKEDGEVTLSVVRERSRRTVRVTPERRERPEVFGLPARPSPGVFVLPDAQARAGRTYVRPAAPRVYTPRVVVRPAAPRVFVPARAWTTVL